MIDGAFEVHPFDHDGTRRLKLTGELDLASAPDLADVLAASYDHDHLVIDTTELQFIDSTGLSALIEARTRMGPDRFQLVAGSPCRRMIEITGLAEFFNL